MTSSMNVDFKNLLQFVAKFNPVTKVEDQTLGWFFSFLSLRIFYLK